MNQSSPHSVFRFFRGAALLTTVLFLAWPLLAAAPTQVDAARSRLTITFRQMGAPIEARFKQLSGAVIYDASAPDKASARLDIETASFDIGDAQYNQEVRKAVWLDSARFPQASFRSSAVRASAAGTLSVSGALTIKGKTQTLTIPVTVQEDAQQQVFSGRLPISRLAYGIGEGEWKDTRLVADEVVLVFRIEQRKTP